MSEQGSVNRRIAEALGYTVVTLPIEGDDGFAQMYRDMGIVEFRLTKPDGSFVEWHDRDVGETVTGLDSTPDSPAAVNQLWGHIPDYLHSLDAVAAELAGKDVRLELDFDTGMATIYDWNEKRMEALEYCASSIDKADAVEAAAHALLKWAEARRGEGV